jgi:hypothetical protein
MVIDPIFVCFLFGAIVCVLVLFDEVLSRDVHIVTSGVLCLYVAILYFLYSTNACSPNIEICQIILGFRDDLGRWLGEDPASLLLIVSGFISFTVDLTGTTSPRWQNIGAYVLIGFWFFFVVEFLSGRVDPVSSFVVLVVGVAFIFLKVVRRRKRKKKREQLF